MRVRSHEGTNHLPGQRCNDFSQAPIGSGAHGRNLRSDGCVSGARELRSRGRGRGVGPGNEADRWHEFFGASDPDYVTFASNATDALNLAIQGLVRPGDHVVSTQLEHNSVLRPLYHLSHRGIIDYDLVPFDGQGFIDPEDVARAIRPNTRLVIVCHASNVLGTVQPADEIGRICAEHDVFLLIDAAQSAGVIPIQMSEWNIAAVAFTGHKSLFGPTGIGGLVIHPGLNIQIPCFLGNGY